VFDLLVHLLEHRDRVVCKEDLIASVWRGRIVPDSTLTRRDQFCPESPGDGGKHQKLIRTVARRGLRFVAAVRVQPHATDQAAPADRGGP
jgi:DNA-binding winged helix-turn-helix (wHTH) protein